MDDTETAASPNAASPFEGLEEEAKRVLSYGASMGMEFDWAVLATATEMGEEPLAESLEQLVHRGILKELNWGDSYAFARVVTLTQIYGEISSSRLRMIHKKIAEAYEKLHPDPTPDIIPEMGRQFFLGRVHEKSLLYNRYAAMLAKDAFSPDVAIRHLERAREDLAALPGDHRVEEAEVLKEIGEQYAALGDDSRANELYQQSLKKLPEEEVTLRALLILSLADAARQMDKLGLARKYSDEAIQLFEKVGHKKGLALAHRTLSRAALKEGRYDVAAKEIEATLALLDPEKDAKEVARCCVDFGNAYSGTDVPAVQTRSIEYYKRAIRTLEQLRDYHELARAHISLAVTLMTASPPEASRELKEAQICAEKCKDWRLVGWALFNSVEVCLALGKDLEANTNNTEARRILSKINDLEGIQQLALNDGILARRRKAYEDSERAFQDAMKRAESLGYPTNVVEVLVHMAIMYFEWGKKDAALKFYHRVKEIGEDNVNIPIRPSYETLKKQLGV
jgi:tetratricopeptide (TPR) repeat protein